ncbi:Hypothetical protein CINCED_3A003107 [Cinara cedri]|nr:Hypothetical protein CINCED_3A003107 [Cinara cedri]
MWDFPLIYRNATWFASFAALGAAAGCLMAESIINSFGPRGAILLSHVICVIGWVLSVTSLTTANLLTGRLFTGAFVGIVSTAASAHSTECFPTRPAARPVVFTAFGVLIVYLTGSLLNYAQTAMVAAFFTAASFVLVRWFIPESPSWLESHGRSGDAEYSRLRLRLVRDGDRPSENPPLAVGLSFLKHANRSEIYRPFLALCLHLVLQQLSAPLVIVSYASQFVSDSGIRVLTPHFISVVLAGFLVAGSLVSTAMNHRQSAAVLSSTGILAGSVLISVYILVRRMFLNRLGSQLLSVVPILGLVSFMASSCIALVPSLPIKDTPGENVAVAFSYTIAFIVIKAYPYVHAHLGWWVFPCFAGMAALNVVYGILMFSDQPKSKANPLTVPSV